MKKYFLVLAGLMCLTFTQTFAQKRGRQQSVSVNDFDFNVMVGLTLGNHTAFILNADADYFVMDNLAVNGGFQIWGGTANLTMGAKYYLQPSWYARARVLVIGNVDFALGTGYKVPLNDRLTLNLASDFYFDATSLGLTGGVSFRL